MFALAQLREMTPDQLRAALSQILPPGSTAEQKVATVESVLNGPAGPLLRAEMARWIVQHTVPVHALVPRQYEHLGPLVADAMQFEVTRLSSARLAPKLVEQIELAANTPPEVRLLRLISKVPGLQKLGQVIGRNRHLKPALRNALTKLENGIRDVKPGEIHRVIRQELGERMEQFDIELSSSILSEASVSAVVRFTWRDPESSERKRGVFKVLKPHIPSCFAEDMDLLHNMAHYLGKKHHEYGYAPRVIQDTFKKVRQLLEHEVDFAGEQHTLLEAARIYRKLPGISVPVPIPTLCTSIVTAMTEQPGGKVTNAARRLSLSKRQKLAERLTEALVAAPLCSPSENSMFHGDPHAGNLLYDSRTETLSLVDWALTERISREQRRHLALLVAMVAFRNPAAVCHEIQALAEHKLAPRQTAMVRHNVSHYLEQLPLLGKPQLTDAMQLLERISLKGIRFPACLIMFSKVIFTLDGIFADLTADSSIGARVARNFVQRWLSRDIKIGAPLALTDWLNLGLHALIFAGKLGVQWEHEFFGRRLGSPLLSGSSVTP